ncbi:MAG TPA: alpha/beta hydrolase [Verrucomicrobiae bacterium]|nr:alpha/beta hydrolase [Verrucomicrobiae bacterium]
MATSVGGKVRSKDGTAIAFSRVGNGQPIISVDGAVAYRSFNPAGAELASLLSPRFTVVTYDRRGRGESGDTPPYAPAREVEDLEALIAEVGGSAFVVAMSSGCATALDAAARDIGIDKLALYEPSFIVDDTRPPMPTDYVARLRSLVASGRRGEAVELFMTAAVGLPAEMVAQMRSAPMWPAMEAVAHTIAYDGETLGDSMSGKPLSRKRWASVSIPTLVMDGGASPAWLRNAAQAVADLIPNAERRTLEGQTHSVDAKVLAPVLEEFFAR